MSKTSIQLLAVELLQPNPFQPRSQIKNEEIGDLVDSIKQYGVLEPLVVAHTPAGYQIIAGERRWRASQLAGLTEVPIIIRETTPRGMLEMAIIENVQRVDLHPIERAKAFQQLQQDFNFTTGDIAKKVSKSASYVSNSMKLLQLPDAIKDGLVGGLISEGHARAIFGIEDKKAMIDLYKQILKENLNVRQTEQRARNYKEKSEGKLKARKPTTIQLNDHKVQAWQDNMQKLLSSKSNITLTRSQRKTKIIIILEGGQDETQQDLEKIMALSEKHSKA